MHIQEAIAAFISYCKDVRKLSPHTIRAYLLDLRGFARFAGEGEQLNSCDRVTIYSYVKFLFEHRQLKEASVKRHLASLRALCGWATEQHGASDPFLTTRIRIQAPKRLPRLISRACLRQLLQAPSRSGLFNDLTARVSVELLFATGMRVSELSGLDDTAVDLAAGIITIMGKGNRERRVFIPADITALLREYRGAREQLHPRVSTFLVSARGAVVSPAFVRRLIRRHAERNHLREHITPHMFRHSLATYLLEEGVDIRYVQRLLGHRSISTTEMYTFVADTVLRSRITESHPRKSILQ